MKTNKIKNKELIKSLIADYLTNYCLVAGLNDLGLKADHYDLQLGDTLFRVMGLAIEDNRLQACFYNFSTRAKAMGIITNRKGFEAIINEVYEWLTKQSKQHENV